MKKILSVILITIMLLSMVACASGQNNNQKSRKVVEIKALEGDDYLERIVEAFNAKQSEWYVTYMLANNDAVLSTLGSEGDTTDIYITYRTYATQHMEPLDELLDTVANGDTIPLKEKFLEDYLHQEVGHDGHYYTLTAGGGVLTIVYNKKLYEQAGVTQVPRTTDELVKICSNLLEEDIVPFVHFWGGGFWAYVIENWVAQYDGHDYWLNNWLTCTDKEGNSPSKSVFTDKGGRYHVLKVLERILKPEYTLKGSNALSYADMATMRENNVAMMVQGQWFGNDPDYAPMKMPVISSITNQLETVKNDMLLRELISAIDAVTEGRATEEDYRSGADYLIAEQEVSAADWEFVKSARNSVTVCYDGHSAYVTNYSKEKEGAMEFLKFFYSDEGQRIYSSETHVALPMKLCTGKIDTDEWGAYDKAMFNIMNEADYFVSSQRASYVPISASYISGNLYGLSPFTAFNADSVALRKTADEFWDQMMEAVDTGYARWEEDNK